MTSNPEPGTRAAEKARHREAREKVVKYHEEELLKLLEHVRDGLRKLDAGEIDAFDLDELIHRYKRSTKELWKFCQLHVAAVQRSPNALAWFCEHSDELDWWEAGEYKRRRRVADDAQPTD